MDNTEPASQTQLCKSCYLLRPTQLFNNSKGKLRQTCSKCRAKKSSHYARKRAAVPPKVDQRPRTTIQEFTAALESLKGGDIKDFMHIIDVKEHCDGHATAKDVATYISNLVYNVSKFKFNYKSHDVHSSNPSATTYRFHCAQLIDIQKKSRKHEDASKHRNYSMMQRYDCDGWLKVVVDVDKMEAQVDLTHYHHPEYVIRNNKAWRNPLPLVPTQAPVAFYDTLAPLYHLIYADYPSYVLRQSASLRPILTFLLGPDRVGLRLFDAACGIGTQCLGLAQHHPDMFAEIVGSDASAGAVERARAEAARVLSQEDGPEVRFCVADMRQCACVVSGGFDVVIAMDDSVPHLLADVEILAALRQFYACLAPGGWALLSLKDYDADELFSGSAVSEEESGAGAGDVQQIMKPCATRVEGEWRYVVMQVWTVRKGDRVYDVEFYFVKHREGDDEMVGTETIRARTRYYAVKIETVIRLAKQAGFRDVKRIEGFTQPIVVGRRAGN